MKKLYIPIIIVLLTICNISCNQISDKENLVIVTKEGSLSSKKTSEEWSKINNLTIEGPIGIEDIAFLKTLDTKGLDTLNLSKAKKINKIELYFCFNKFKYLVLPDSTEEIDLSAFQDCPNLESVQISKDNKHYKSVDGVIYTKDNKKLIVYPAARKAKKYQIPDNTEELGHCALNDAKYLEEITISKKNSSFMTENGILYTKNKESLRAYPAGKKDTLFTLPATVTDVYWASFWGCKYLKNINVEKGNTEYQSIEGCLVQKGTKIIACPAGKKGNLTIPDGIEEIDDGAFRNCDEIQTIYLGKNISGIYKTAFTNSNINQISQDNESYKIIDGLVFQDKLLYLCLPQRSGAISLPKETESISERAFQRCDNIKDITINGAFYIGAFAFSYCKNLQKVIIKEGTQKMMDRGAFFCCPNLREVTLPNSIYDLGESTFQGDFNLKKIKCYSEIPPKTRECTFKGINTNECELFVPAKAIETYKKEKNWNKFSQIKPL